MEAGELLEDEGLDEVDSKGLASLSSEQGIIGEQQGKTEAGQG